VATIHFHIYAHCRASGSGIFSRLGGAGFSGEHSVLAGQLHDYISGRLTRWSRERQKGPEAGSTEMELIARSLTESQIFAVAAYLSYLE
jgi:cytochrome c553